MAAEDEQSKLSLYHKQSIRLVRSAAYLNYLTATVPEFIEEVCGDELNILSGSIFVGDKSAAENKDDCLSNNNIAAVLALTKTLPETQVDGIEYHLYAVEEHCLSEDLESDAHEEMIAQYFDNTYDVIDNQLNNQKNVLIYGAMGSFSTTIAAAYLIRKLEISVDRALDIVELSTMSSAPLPGFVTQLKNEYENQS